MPPDDDPPPELEPDEPPDEPPEEPDDDDPLRGTACAAAQSGAPRAIATTALTTKRADLVMTPFPKVNATLTTSNLDSATLLPVEVPVNGPGTGATFARSSSLALGSGRHYDALSGRFCPIDVTAPRHHRPRHPPPEQSRDGERRAGHAGADDRQAPGAKSPAAVPRPRPRGICGHGGGRLRALRPLRGQARGAPRQPRARGRRARARLAHGSRRCAGSRR